MAELVTTKGTPIAWRWHPNDNPGHGWTYTESKARADWCKKNGHPCEPLYNEKLVSGVQS